ncbi:unnamed protein product [Paramecium sonneborni]|uniref:Uncharacterized protein n=1 Tax=Paramecium sonneborni TaxID=65129 RepID=A0A8S1RSW4_9CILI|nr:unnamed protein product [Paramecium sonneborni]
MNNFIYKENVKNKQSIKKCNSSNSNMFNNHQEYFAWNPNFAIVYNFNSEGCQKKKDNSSLYLDEQVCKSSILGESCYWDNNNEQCKDDDPSFTFQIEEQVIQLMKIVNPLTQNAQSLISKKNALNTKTLLFIQKQY